MEEIKKITYEKHELKLKILSPVHIGSGERYYPSNFIFNNGKLIRVDMIHFYNEVLETKELKDKFIEYMLSDETSKYLRNFFNQINKKSFKPLYKLDYYSTLDFTEKKDEKNQKQILKKHEYKEAIKDRYYKFYIPGSSIKGAIVNALIYHRLKYGKNDLHSKNIYGIEEEIKNLIDGRTIQITDSTSTDKGAIRQENNIGIAKTRGPLNYCETIEPDQELKAELRLIEYPHISQQSVKITEIKNAIYEFSNDILLFMQEKLSKDRNKPIYDKIQLSSLSRSNSKQEPLLCLGRYKGFFLNTISYLVRDDSIFFQILSQIPHPGKKKGMKHNKETFPKSLNVFLDKDLRNYVLPGWVKIEIN